MNGGGGRRFRESQSNRQQLQYTGRPSFDWGWDGDDDPVNLYICLPTVTGIGMQTTGDKKEDKRSADIAMSRFLFYPHTETHSHSLLLSLVVVLLLFHCLCCA